MTNEYREQRLKKLSNFREAGIDPYPAGPFEKTPLKIVQEMPVGQAATVCGRIVLFRGMGNICFFHIQDESGRFQIMLSKKDFEGDFKFWIKNLDIGDFVSVAGERFDTQKGERSLHARQVTLLAKSLLPLPDKHHALTDEELKLRKRYLDILFNPDIKDMIYKKDRFWNSMRQFLKERGFTEVQTPVLEVATGGADARPFATHHNALDLDVYLRISMGELWQKRLMVAGLEKTFEIGRQFRNEGMDAEHLQDYDQMEFYWAYANYECGMALVEDLFKYVAQETFGTLKFSIKDFEVDLGLPWKRYDYVDVIREMTGVNVKEITFNDLCSHLDALGIRYEKDGFNLGRAIDTLWKHCRKSICGPGFLINEPKVVSPLAKSHPDDSFSVQRFHVLIAGSELGNGYSELNDPIDQAERFSAQAKLRAAGDEEAQMNDTEFVEALEYGMPPTCGFGLSERVFAFFMNKTVRECQIFPLMRPK